MMIPRRRQSFEDEVNYFVTYLDATPEKAASIIDASLDLFARHGFEGTSIPMITRAAKSGPGTIYRRFEHKEGLLNAVYRHTKARMLTSAFRFTDLEAPYKSQFYEVCSRLLDWAHANPAAYLFLEHHFHAPYLDDVTRDFDGHVGRLMVAVYSDPMDNEIIKRVPIPMAVGFILGSLAQTVRNLQLGRLTYSEELRVQWLLMIWEGLRN